MDKQLNTFKKDIISYINRLQTSGPGKKKSLEFLEKFVSEYKSNESPQDKQTNGTTQLVINIPEEYYMGCKRKMVLDTTVTALIDAIANGVVLPDNHGRLIDADKLKKHERDVTDGNCTWLMDVYLPDEIEEAPTVLERAPE